MNKKVTELKTKIQTETYHLRRMFDSCETKEQVENTLELTNYLISVKWDNLINYCNNFTFHEQLYLLGWVKSAANDLTKIWEETKEKLIIA